MIISGLTKLKIVELAYDMNKKGKHRSISKTEYIKILKQIHNNNNNNNF
jgi:hypothetical protein